MNAPRPFVILNVDDDGPTRYAKTRILMQAGFTVLEAGTGVDALRLVPEAEPDLVLLDVKLPDIDGIEVCRRIKELRPDQLVMQISGAFIASSDRVRGLESGADSYLTQPVAAEELVAAVRALLRIRTMEDALRESEDHYRNLVELNPQLPWTADPAGAILDISPRWLAMTGLDRPAALAAGWLQTVAPEDQPASAAAWQRAVTTGEPFDVEHRVRLADGAFRWMRSRAFPRRANGGGILRWYGTTEDIDDRKRAEAALTETRERLGLALEAADLAIWDWNLATGATYFSPRWAVLMGCDGETAEPSLALRRRLIATEDAVAATESLDDHLAGWTLAYQSEHRVVSAGGRVHWVQEQGKVVERDEDGRPVRIVGTLKDISERKLLEQRLRDLNETLEQQVAERTRQLRVEMESREQAEAQLRHAQRLETLGQLTGGVAHDFNNLLQAVGSCLAALDHHVPVGQPRQLFDAAQQAIARGGRLTRSLLAFSRRQSLKPVPTALGTLLETMRPLLKNTLGGLIQVEVEVDPDTPLTLVDPAQLEAAVLNLAINGRDAMPEGGLLRIRTSAADGRAAADPPPPADLKPGPYVVLTVTDTGCGMEPAILARVFEPFFTTKAVGHGSGLGLSMVHGMAAQSGGGVAIASTPGQGTAVTLFLPVADGPAAIEPAAPPLQEVPPETCILLVEDDTLVRLGTASLLASHDGCRVIDVGDGMEALQVLQSGVAIDIMVTDYAMPGMNGAELVQEARRVCPDLPVLLVTGHVDRPAALPDVPMLQKPYHARQLAAKIGNILGNPVFRRRAG